MAAGEKTIQEAREAWWTAWWKADYSWEGLAKKQWRGWAMTPAGQPVRRIGRIPAGARPATLQDFWRAESTHLISDPEHPDRKWTRVHLPANWSSGAPAKVTWSDDQFSGAAEALVTAIATLPANAFDRPAPATPPKAKRSPVPQRISPLAFQWAVPLDGAVFRELPEAALARSYVQGRRMAFFDSVLLTADGSSFDLRYCLFGGGLEVNSGEADGADNAGAIQLTGSTFIVTTHPFWGPEIRR